jgi:Flp pilus assembly protein TadD
MAKRHRKHFSEVNRETPMPKWSLLQAPLIILAGLWVFWPTVHGGWIGDDNWYLVDNPLMNDPARIWKAWFQPGSWVEYYPIEETVQWLQWQLWHADTFGYHLTNISLHLISALLVWRLLGKFGLPLAWLGGLLFAVHPMVVDSVALINEFKTSLSLPPFLLAMCAWIDYEEQRRPRDYALALAFFVVAMLGKVTMMMFPVVILLYAWWKRRRIGWHDLKVSTPFFAVSLVLVLISIHSATVYSGPDTALLGDVPRGDLISRFVLAGQTIAFYFSRCFLPVDPTPIYPQWGVDPYSPLQYLPWIVLGLVFGFLCSKRETWGRHAFLGLGFFLIMLAPFWGFHWISYMNATWILEHLLYIPIIGLIGLVVAGMGEVARQISHPARLAGAGVLMLVVGFLTWESHGYAGMFKDEATIGAYTVHQNPGCALAHNNLGVALAKMGRTYEAIDQFEAALRIDPKTANANDNLGDAFLKVGRIPEAIAQHQTAIQLWPGSAQAHCCLGDDLMQAGRVSEAIAAYTEAVRLEPDSDWMHYNLGLVLRHNGRTGEAIEEYRKAIAINPNYAEAHNSLGIALFLTGQIGEARQHFEAAIRINSQYLDARNNLARLEAASPAPNAGN